MEDIVTAIRRTSPHKLINMLAKLLTTLCLVALAAAENHITVSSKTLGPEFVVYDGPYYYIPKGQCSAFINKTYLCGEEVAKGIEIKVTDPSGFVDTTIFVHPVYGSSDVVISRPSCPEPALVDVRLSCEHWKSSHSRNRLPLPPLYTSPESHSDEDDDDDDDDDDEDDEVEEDEEV
ncbi:nucleophosmin-like [Aricia agestis]|uniref:nucleophosmin-like n=1 Tax=Aricia agestis TaxID=91739 RepID=UPI001C20297F|nr:nucleophosmin-like [Aricia agestis]